MGYWTKSESIYFDWVLAELFEWLGDYSDACEEWTEEHWRSEFDRILGEKNYPPEDEAAARAELERFLPIRHKESIWDDGEREVLRGEAWEKVFHENQEREKRKAKQIPQVREWIREYQTNKEALEREQDEAAYKAMLDTCYNLMFHWDTVSCLDEFSGMIDFTEQTALSFYEKMKTVESLYYLTLFYTDRKLIWAVNSLEWRKEQLLKGIPYARLLYELLKDEESAERYGSCYLLLDQFCRAGEDLEQLGYADQAYTLTKEIVARTPTEKTRELLEMAKLAETSFYGMHDLEGLKQLFQDDYERLIQQLSEGNLDEESTGQNPLSWMCAIEFAKAHYEKTGCSYLRQQEKEGWCVSKPYGDFVIEVMKALAQEGIECELIYVVAALHNLVGKTDCTYEEIGQHFTGDVAGIVEILDRKDGEDFFQNLDRCTHEGDGLRGNICADILLAEKLCQLRLCGQTERLNERQRQELQDQIVRFRVRNWREAEQMGKELVKRMSEDGTQ